MAYRLRSLSSALFVLGSLAACGGTTTESDAGGDAAPTPCATDHDCDDGVYCNGPAVCVPGVGCIAGAAPCASGQICSETAHSCTTDCRATADADGDTHLATLCGGDDCDDSDPLAYPGRIEVCDAASRDEDCDPLTYGFRDQDGDGASDATCCNGTHCGSDCDDNNSAVHPTQAETCNGRDDDCNGAVDDGITNTWTVDADRDGHGSSAAGATTMQTCSLPVGYAALADDCADDDPARHPGLPEICNGVDDDCSGTIDDVPSGTCDCSIGAMQNCPLSGRCAGAMQTCTPAGRWGACTPGPVAETCNGMDDDCNGIVDDGLRVNCYADSDDDGYAIVGTPMTSECASPDAARMGPPRGSCPVGFTARAPIAGALDCCEGDASAYPGATAYHTTARVCGGYDYDCDTAETRGGSTPTDTCASRSVADCESAVGWRGADVPACGETRDVDTCAWTGIGTGCLAVFASGVPTTQACR